MSFILLLLMFVTWMAWSPEQAGGPYLSDPTGLAIFFGVYVCLVLLLRLWSRRLSSRVVGERILEPVGRFNRVITLGQMFVPAWLAAGIFVLGYGRAVDRVLGESVRTSVELPGILLGVLPGMLAWMGLWWAQFPVDRALREQNLLARLNAGLPVYPPPTFRSYFAGKLRMQVLLPMIPILLIIAFRDLARLAIRLCGLDANAAGIDLLMSALATGSVFILAPEVLRRVLRTESLADPILRTRLAEVVRHAGIRYRDVLLWRTHQTVGNAMVMGLVPRFRYVLLSDVLLESLKDDEVVAVFAHEIGHISHRHMVWYAMFFVGLMLGLVGLNNLADLMGTRIGVTTATIDLFFPFVGVFAMFFCFGYLSRRFERQADVYAARTMEAMKNPNAGDVNVPVGLVGASIFNSALLRVAEVNNVPLEVRGHFSGGLRQRVGFAFEWFATLAGSWLHGTMMSRMRYITQISQNPQLTSRFDRRMKQTRIALVGLFLACGAWAAVAVQSDAARADGSAAGHAIGAAAVNGSQVLRAPAIRSAPALAPNGVGLLRPAPE